LINFARDFISPTGKDQTAQNTHPEYIGQHLGGGIPGKRVLILQQSGPEVIKTDQDHHRAEAFHEKAGPLGQAFLPVQAVNEKIFFHLVFLFRHPPQSLAGDPS